MSEREFREGAFYWVKRFDRWTVGHWDGTWWTVVGDNCQMAEGWLQEIGTCIGKEPPAEPLATDDMAEEIEYLRDYHAECVGRLP